MKNSVPKHRALTIALTLIFLLFNACLLLLPDNTGYYKHLSFLNSVLALAVGSAWTARLLHKGCPEPSNEGSGQQHATYYNSTQPYFWKFAMNSVSDYFYAKDLQGRFLGQNKALLDLYNHAQEADVIGKTNSELYPTMDKEAVKKLEAADLYAAHSHLPLITEESVPSKNGELMICESSKCSYRSPDGTILGMFCVSRNITSRKQVEAAMLKSRAEAQAANAAKSTFLANTSHEIRTPLNGIIGMLYLAMQSDITQEQRGYLEKADESARHLLNVISDILDFSKIEAGKMQLEYLPFSLEDACRHIADLYSLSARQAGVRVSFSFDPLIPPLVMGDSLRIKQVLTNLVANAVKFTHEGSIDISCSLLEMNEDRIRLSTSVRDTGIGISEKQLAGLFEAFSQGDVSKTRLYGGTGLGLAISKELVALMHGEITVQSRKDEGTTFTFTSLLGVASEQNVASLGPPEPPSLPVGLLAGRRVLLVEDNSINRLIATEIMEKCAIIVDEAQNGVEALEKIYKNQYDIVLMDIQMPLMDGLTATRILRQDRTFDKLPVIAMTAHAMKSDYEESLAAGLQEHVTKPIDPQLLYQVLLRWINT